MLKILLLLDLNQIKSMNGQSILGLAQLREVQLSGNECIDENFFGPAEIAAKAKIVTEKCDGASN